MGKYMIILMFLLIAITVVFATYNLSIIRSMPPEERYKLLYFKDDQVSIGIGLIKKNFKISDIREVRFSKGKQFRSMGSWAGRMQICKLNGKTSRWIEFDGTVYYKKMVYITNEEIIDKAIDLLMNEFQARGIRCTKIKL
ncbi:hypothetical protein DW997_08590 [Veillonella sp. AM51-8BH]|uniref:hypothetical protein n=1 Tax=Veillonella sp. AM51-8BH TaxID=2292378 RepID=UPI000E5C8DCE|nr:hypothetical protein [Veillonella sp. AM51-8BH]RGZ22126.1 hypothetical protein DW997_08590 [Veillonella sp. AM51-8BH]